MKLEFGAGEKQTPGFKNVDVRDLPGIDYVCEAWKIDELVDENSVDGATSPPKNSVGLFSTRLSLFKIVPLVSFIPSSRKISVNSSFLPKFKNGILGFFRIVFIKS